MAYSSGLQALLKKGSFPLLASSGFALWEELIARIEKDPAGATAEAKALATNFLGDLDDTIWDTAWSINGVDITVSLTDIGAFIGGAHAALTKDFGQATNMATPIPGFIARLRKKASTTGVVQTSGVTLHPVDAHHGMGTGLVTTSQLTYLPDPSLGSHSYGSVPDIKAITTHAPSYADIQKRVYETNTTPVGYGAKKHYVLAHLINHNINGSGKDVKNVIPLWAAANKTMSDHVEKHLVEFVRHGVPVRYTITTGPAVGMTVGRAAALASAPTAEQRDVITAEQYLPAYLTITLEALDSTKNWITIVNARQIDNYVPETVPLI